MKKFRLLIFILILFIPFFFFMFIYIEHKDILEGIDDYKPVLSTKIYDRHGKVISELFEENRSYTDIRSIPKIVKQAFVATEDANFFQHNGMDIKGIVRAIIVDILAGSIKQGGSTITQQLAKQLYTKSQKTLRRKVLELLIAYELERRYSKSKILEMYLNQIYFGHGTYGVQAASRFYFEKDVSNLNVIEASILASIPSAPNKYSPIKHPRNTFEKSKKVLFNMIKEGYVTKSDVVKIFTPYWKKFLSHLKGYYSTLGVRSKRFDHAPYFTEYIRRKLIKSFGEKKVYRGGLKVYTTLDLSFQKIGQNIINNALLKQNPIAYRYNRWKLSRLGWLVARKKYRKWITRKKAYTLYKALQRNDFEYFALIASLFPNTGVGKSLLKHFDSFGKLKTSANVEGALVALKPQTGEIVTMIGGGSFSYDNQLNRAVQARRQPGSSFKAFVYGAGIESRRITPATMFLDVPVVFRGGRKTWRPSNYERSYGGRVLVRNAFASSLNIVSAMIYNRIGGYTIARFSSRVLGIPLKRFEVDPTLALGTSEVTPLELARGFAVFANHGRSVHPYAISHIIDNTGKKIYDVKRKRLPKRQIISRETAFIMTSMMQSVVNYGTASHGIRNMVGFRHPAAGKTGTNSKWRDAWFAGFTTDLVATVWLGCDSQKYTLGPHQTGGLVAAPLWARFMKQVYKGKKKRWFYNTGRHIIKRRICRHTGKIPVKGCKIKYEYFLRGTGPRKKCDSNHDSIAGIKKLFDASNNLLHKAGDKLEFFKNSDDLDFLNKKSDDKSDNGDGDKNLKNNKKEHDYDLKKTDSGTKSNTKNKDVNRSNEKKSNDSINKKHKNTNEKKKYESILKKDKTKVDTKKKDTYKSILKRDEKNESND